MVFQHQLGFHDDDDDDDDGSSWDLIQWNVMADFGFNQQQKTSKDLMECSYVQIYGMWILMGINGMKQTIQW